MLECRQRWILDGRPRGSKHQSFANYKSAKYLFRDELRKANVNFEINASNLIEDSLEFDQKTAWSLINCRRSRKSNAAILKTNGNLLTDPNDVCNEFAKHFEQIVRIAFCFRFTASFVQRNYHTCLPYIRCYTFVKNHTE
jgi:hypothetical protein